MDDKSKQAVEVYEKICQQYADEFDEPSFQIDNFVDLLPKNGKVLDVGCGVGTDVGYLTSKNFKVEGIDLSGKMLEIAKNKHPDAIFRNADMRNLDYQENSFDGILASFSLIHIPKSDVPNTLKGFYKTLKTKGIIYIGIQEGKSEEIFITETFRPSEKIFLNIMSRSELKKLLKDSGFQILRYFGRKPQNSEEFDYTKYVVIAIKASMEKEIGLKKGFVKVDKYDPQWQEEFNKEKENLKKIFGNVAKSIEHVGSTSIAGLSAKPIIDIAIGVDALEDINKIKEKILKFSHYTIKEDNADGEILMRKGEPVKSGEIKPDFITHFIHIMEINGRKYRETIVFRDYLKTNKAVLKEYDDLKQKLVIEYKNDRKAYSKAKHEFIESIQSKCDLD